MSTRAEFTRDESIDATIQPGDVSADWDAEKGTKGDWSLTLNDDETPKMLPLVRKWIAVLVICSAALCVACTSSIAASAETGETQDFHVSKEVTILGVSLFVSGLGLGPLLLGPLSEFYGRNPVYWVSYTLFWIFSWPVAFAPNIAVFLVFRFIGGFSGAAFLSVAGGSVSDLFTNEHVANPMAVYTVSPFIGPVVGPLISGFINQNLNWRWTYRVQLIWSFLELIALIFLVPETFEPILLKRRAARLVRAETRVPMLTGIFEEYAKKREEKSMRLWNWMAEVAAIFTHMHSFLTVSSELIAYERMALLLDLWNALVLGILYLAFQAFPIIFEEGHGFDIQATGMSFLGIGLGMLLALASQPYWNRVYERENRKYEGGPPPEVRLLIGMPGGILVAIGLYWIAFTTFNGVHWILPILGSIPFGIGILYVFTATFTYLVTAYRPIAASAMAGNSAIRSAFAAGFPLFATQMYSRLGTVGATALLAGLTTLMAPLPFIFYRYGAKIRSNSKFAVT